MKLVSLAGAKDASELYLQDRDGFAESFEQALQQAIPYEEHERIAAELRARAAWENAGDLAKKPRILDVFKRELDGAGVVGERRLCKLIYLAVTGRFLDRFASIAVKGPSASGKSWAIERVLEFFPPEAYYLLTAMSERALAYGTEPLSHRFLVLFEAAGLESDFASYLVRSLLSEGCVRYETVEKSQSGELRARLIEREGPTGLIVSTTSVALHPENETRLLSLSATDTPDQTKLVLSTAWPNDELASPTSPAGTTSRSGSPRRASSLDPLREATRRARPAGGCSAAPRLPRGPLPDPLARDLAPGLAGTRRGGPDRRDVRRLRGRPRARRRHRLRGHRGHRPRDCARARRRP